MNIRSKIAITVGDPAGIGTEVTVKALRNKDVTDKIIPVLYAHKVVLESVCGNGATLKRIKSQEEAKGDYGVIEYIEPNEPIANNNFEFGKVQASCGLAAYNYIDMAIKDALEKKVAAVVTAPINKESIKAAKIDFIGHTEIFAEKTNSYDPLTMFEVRELRVFFLTRHLSLIDACKKISKERIVEYIKRCTDALNQIGVSRGTMAVAALNPHCGEHGLFGDEEGLFIVPAIEEALRLGYKVTGPIGADSVFHQALIGKYNSVLSLYHDQGHIATKTLDFDRVVSLTLGLPFLRTSVDHGTAFDIAGKNTASEISMIEALLVTSKYSNKF